AQKEGYDQLRISGGEPTVGREHLTQVLLRLQARKLTFILETNGILLGHEPNYAEDLARFPFLHVRVSLKGCTPKDFSKLTGAKRDGFNLQLEALRRLVEAGVSCHPSVMASFSTSDDIRKVCESLGAIDPRLKDELEVEELILYPHVQRRLEKYRIGEYRSYDPHRVPRELV
ncbi:MAG: radical SAM protein, partial [Aigarchaeota archaeon]|nr:radical SAM protein [Aigarchaeota archaeon]